MHTVVKKSQAIVRHISDYKTAYNLITNDISPDVSLATTESSSLDYYEKETTPYNRIYYVLEGKLELTCDDSHTTLAKGDASFINQGTTYEIQGKFQAVVINQPAFGSKSNASTS